MAQDKNKHASRPKPNATQQHLTKRIGANQRANQKRQQAKRDRKH